MTNKICLKTLFDLPGYSARESELSIWWQVWFPTANGDDTLRPMRLGLFPQGNEHPEEMNHRKGKCYYAITKSKCRKPEGKRNPWFWKHLLPCKEYIIEDTIFLSQWTDISQDLHIAKSCCKYEDTMQEPNLVSILTFKQRNVAVWVNSSDYKGTIWD